MGGVLRHKLEVYCSVSLSSRLRGQRGTALQMGGVLQYKLEVYCQYFADKLYGLGVPEQCLIRVCIVQKNLLNSRPRDTKSLVALSLSTLGHSGCFDTRVLSGVIRANRKFE